MSTENKSQINLATLVSYRFDNKTFTVHYSSSETAKGKNCATLNVKEYGWFKGFIVALILGYVVNYMIDKEEGITKDDVNKYKDQINSFLEKITWDMFTIPFNDKRYID